MLREIGSYRLIWILSGAVWLGGTAAGLAWMADYANRPGPAASAPAHWPLDSRIPRDPARPTLVMLVHPQCDCSRASVAELAELMARARRRPKTFVLFMRPSGVGSDWDQTTLWQSAARIPDVTLVRDDDGLEARRFGCQTSGETLLYDAAGQLQFSGGTTIARGHLGENPGVAAMLALLDGNDPHRTSTPVFGCSLFEPANVPSAKESAPQ
jgi:hypothetical protein